jgi:hypothetical protein
MIRYWVYAVDVLVIMTNDYQKALDVFKLYSIYNNCEIIDKIKGNVVAVCKHNFNKVIQTEIF